MNVYLIQLTEDVKGINSCRLKEEKSCEINVCVRDAKHWCEKGKKDNTTSLWHYRTLLEFDPSALSIQDIFTVCEIRAGQKYWCQQKKEEKKTLDTTEVLAKSIYRYVIF